MDFQKFVPIIPSRGANLHTFCSSVSPDHCTIGPVVKFENQQEFLCAASLHPARQITTEKGGESSHVANFGVNYSQKGKSVDFVRQIFMELAGTGNISFCTMIDFSRVRGIYTTSMELDIVEIVRQFQKILW